jgi:hypothetical protein
MFIADHPDPGSESRILGSKKHRIPETDPQHGLERFQIVLYLLFAKQCQQRK